MREQIARHSLPSRPVRNVQEDDAWWLEEEEPKVVPPEFSGPEIADALAAKKLTPDHCWFLHEQGLSWRVDVRKGGRGQ